MAFGDLLGIPRKAPTTTDHVVSAIDAGLNGASKQIYREVIELGGSDTFGSGSVTVSSVSISIVSSRARRRTLTIFNDSGSETIHIDGSAATTGTFPLGPKASFTFNDYSGSIFAIRGGSVDATVWYLETWETA